MNPVTQSKQGSLTLSAKWNVIKEQGQPYRENWRNRTQGYYVSFLTKPTKSQQSLLQRANKFQKPSPPLRPVIAKNHLMPFMECTSLRHKNHAKRKFIFLTMGHRHTHTILGSELHSHTCRTTLTLSILRSSILDRHVLACCVTDEISRIALYMRSTHSILVFETIWI
jgi:hypothetical protein